jgi:hypothetical protein
MKRSFIPGFVLFSLKLSAQSVPASVPPTPVPGNPFLAPSASAQTTTPQTLHERFMDYAIAAYGPRAVLTPVFVAAFRMADPPKNYPREWSDGPEAFGRNYGDSFVRAATLQTGRFAAGALLHEDFRYRPSTSKKALARTFHAIGFAFVDKSDSGGNRLAIANLVGAGANGFVGDLYLPHGYDNLSHVGSRAAFAMGTIAAKNLAREFAPEVYAVSRKIHLPFGGFPEWWVKR